MDHKYNPLSLYMSNKSMYGLDQGPHIKNAQLVENLKSRVEVVEEIIRSVEFDRNLMEDKVSAYLKDILVSPSYAKTVHTTKAHRLSREQYLSVILLCVAYRGQSNGRLLQELKNDALKGQSTFPATMAEALAMINDYSDLDPTPRLIYGYEGVPFSQKRRGPHSLKMGERSARQRRPLPGRRRRKNQVKERSVMSPLSKKVTLLLQL